MEGLLEQFSPGLFIWQTVLFILLIFLLRKFAWKPILNSIQEREEEISDSIEAARKAKAELEKLETQSEELLNEARVDRDKILKEARDTRDKLVSEAKDKAKSESEKIISDAREAINNEKMAAITELKNEVATLSIDIAEKILKEQLSEKDKQATLVNNLLEEVKLN